MNAVEVLHVLVACLWCCAEAKRTPKRFHYGFVPEDPKPVVMTSTVVPVAEAGPQLWPLGRIPFVDDPDLVKNEDQAVALNNARMDLQIRTCVKFVPRKNERDYVYFTDLGMDVECWNMFEQNHGHVAVNAGPSCLAPMRWPYKPHQVFSDCDIEYVNHLYNCPRRHRKHSPICPAGNTIMALPQPPPAETPEPPIPLPPPTKKKVRSKTKTHTPFPPHIELPTPPPLPSSSPPAPPTPPMELEVFTLTPTPDPPTTTTTEATTTTTLAPTTVEVIITTVAEVTNEPANVVSTTTVPLTVPVATTEQTSDSGPSETGVVSPMSSYPPTPQPITAEIVDTVLEMTTEVPVATEETHELVPIVQTTHIKAKVTTQTFAPKNQIGIRGKISHKDGLKSYKMKSLPTDMTMDDRPVGTCGSPCNYTGGVIPLRRSYNDKMGITDHFYTEDLVEQKNKVLDGYLLQTPMGFIGKSSNDPTCTCLRPLYRLYNDFLKDHLLTSREHEKEVAERILGYKYDKVLGFCTKEPGCGAYMPLYRFYNPIAKDHLYTVDEQEMQYYKKHPEHAYGFEYIECYVWKQQQVGADCPLQNLAINKAEMAQLALMGWSN
ncbi:unnamed protein product [Bursaphelenchus okinawaensis]|uniref:DUF5648 domain-containing protein n=1 Tax=Bursaphelenchus okinawaensis TaxID=465554 RepID=A0A811KB52_9BILA|nr:unnamed protein product [Bursaphelenchus okinawaensis]CAG9097334.1 unnamed protein product [Bursaphelenchus okinawaensis]